MSSNFRNRVSLNQQGPLLNHWGCQSQKQRVYWRQDTLQTLYLNSWYSRQDLIINSPVYRNQEQIIVHIRAASIEVERISSEKIRKRLRRKYCRKKDKVLTDLTTSSFSFLLAPSFMIHYPSCSVLVLSFDLRSLLPAILALIHRSAPSSLSVIFSLVCFLLRSPFCFPHCSRT